MQYITCFNLRFAVACKIPVVTNSESNHDIYLMIKFVTRNFDCSGKKQKIQRKHNESSNKNKNLFIARDSCLISELSNIFLNIIHKNYCPSYKFNFKYVKTEGHYKLVIVKNGKTKYYI